MSINTFMTNDEENSICKVPIKPSNNRPHSHDFWVHYLDYDNHNAEEVWTIVGGALGKKYGGPDPEDSCATRVSHAINHSGYPIPKDGPMANRVWGGKNDGKYYIISAAKLKQYLGQASVWGKPDFPEITFTQFDALPSVMKKGQVAVVVSTAHATVVMGNYADYAAEAAVGGDAWVLPV